MFGRSDIEKIRDSARRDTVLAGEPSVEIGRFSQFHRAWAEESDDDEESEAKETKPEPVRVQRESRRAAAEAEATPRLVSPQLHRAASKIQSRARGKQARAKAWRGKKNEGGQVVRSAQRLVKEMADGLARMLAICDC